MYSKHLSRDKSEVLICLHGWGQSHSSLTPLAKALSNHYHTVLLDLPGFGSSEKPQDSADTLSYAKLLKDWISQNKWDKVHILGHSFGGKIAMTLAQDHPKLFHTLTLIAPSGGRRFHSFKHRLRVYKARLLSKAANLLQKTFKINSLKRSIDSKYSSSDFKNAGAMKKVFINVINDEQPKHPEKIAPPVLFLVGSDDKDTPLSSFKDLLKTIPNTSLISYQHKDHFPFSGSGIDLLSQHIHFFIQGSLCS